MSIPFLYIDPGSGFVFAQQAYSILWLIILGMFGFLTLSWKIFFKFVKKFLWIFIILVAILTIIGAIMNSRGFNKKKVIVLGIDGMDPYVTEKLMNEGRLPNLASLKHTGTFSLLKTTNPSESVVAWTGFSTGMNPGGHGIFDFIMRNPADYMPYLSLNEITNSPVIKINNRCKAKLLWDYLSDWGIASYVYFCPNTFPAKKLNGVMLSGMGTPDLYGTMGRFSFYTSNNIDKEKTGNSRGKIISIKPYNGVIETAIYGPKMGIGGAAKEADIPLRITLDAGKEGAKIEFQRDSFFLKRYSWSGWRRLYFKTGPFKKIYGIVRFYLKDIGPDFELYVSPINFDPANPVFPIAYPRGYAKKVAKAAGLYHTQGMPHDTWALSEGLLDEKTFLEQADKILEERKAIILEEVKNFKNGFFFFYIDTLDSLQHMFWKNIGSRNPYENTVYEYYVKIDGIIGAILKGLDKDTIMIILSDHGFNSFQKAVHLNRWLMENNFLFLNGGKTEGEDFFKDVDWTRTRAYALGFGGIYINKKGRESKGIVLPQEEALLKKEIASGLKLWLDPATQKNIIKDVYAKEDIFNGPHSDSAPDLFVGFNAGYRASWQTALGGAPEELMEDNNKKWSGDHLMDPSIVPGILFINKKTDLKDPNIIDLAPTVLKLFNISDYKKMDGKPLCDF